MWLFEYLSSLIFKFMIFSRFDILYNQPFEKSFRRIKRKVRHLGKKYISKSYCKKDKKNKFENNTKFISDKVLKTGLDEYTVSESLKTSLL